MYKLDLEKAEEPERKLPVSAGSQREQENSRKKKKITSTSFTMLNSLIVWITTNLWKILKETGVLNNFNCLLRSLLRKLYAGQEASVRTRHGTTDWFKIGKGVCQGCTFLPNLFNFYAEYITQKCQAG